MGEKRAFGAAAAVCVLAICACSSLAAAQTERPTGVTGSANPDPVPEDTYETPYTLGMGLGVRAGASGTSGLALNASNMGGARGFDLEAFSQIIPSSSGGTYWTFGSAVVDSTTSDRITLGTSYRYIFQGEDRQYQGWDWRTAIGVMLIEQLSLGVSVRWGRMNSRWSDGERLGPFFDGVTMDASLTITPIPWLKIAGLGYNLIKTGSTLAPQMAGGSVSIAPVPVFSFGGDVLVDLTTFTKTELLFGGAAQFIAGEKVPLRFGYRRDNGRVLNQLTASVGFTQGKFGIEAALRQTIGNNKETYLVTAFRFKIE